MHSANRLLPLSSISSTSGDGQALRRGGVERVNSGQHPRWQAAFLLPSLFFIFGLSENLLPWERGRWCGWGVEGVRGHGEDSTCTGSWSGSGTCTCRRRTAGVGPGPGCSLDPGRAAPLGSFSGRPPPRDTATPGGCWNRSALLQKATCMIIRNICDRKTTVTPNSHRIPSDCKTARSEAAKYKIKLLLSSTVNNNALI